MEIISSADKLLIQILGKQKKISDSAVRPLKWTLKLSVDEGFIIHNFLTGECLFFENETDITAGSEYMYSRYFFVPEDNDDIKLAEELRLAVRLIDRKKEITSYKILTTTDCNARCFYCYEAGMKRENMSTHTADALVEYIRKKSDGKKITLSWFGGEPLLNKRVIDHICSELRKSGIEYTSVMTSNGYLFTPETIKIAKEKWNLKNIQITLDGTRDVYNRIKAYIDAVDDPFERVMGNIKILTDNKIHVNIRLNMNTDNYEDLLSLADELSKRFQEKEYMSVYANGLFQDTHYETDDKKRKDVFVKLGYLSGYLHDLGLSKSNKKSLKLRVRSCMADGDSHRGISPAGKLIKCEHHIFDKLTGDIFENNEDLKVLENWKKKLPYGDNCKDCFALPTCYKLAGCPVSHICDNEEKKNYTDSLKNTILQQYALRKKKR